MPETRLTFLGTASALPGPHQDTACYLVNGRLLIDTGWYAALKMLQYGYDPLDVQTLFFTHGHHDHYLGLPALLFYRGMMERRGHPRPPLKIVGPADALEVIELAHRFLQVGRYERVVCATERMQLPPGETYEVENLRVETLPALHPVPAVSFRVTDLATGVTIVGSGDTAPNPALAELARDCDLLIHEASLAPEAEPGGPTGHSRAVDAAEIARVAGAKRLRLVHLDASHAQRSLAAARRVFPEARLAAEGETIVWRNRG